MIFIHNPHTKIFFWQTLADFILRNNVSRKSQKYKYILDFLWRNNCRFWIYIDYKESTLPQLLKKKPLIRMEIFFWLIIKRINPFFIKIVDNIDILSREDIFFSFSLKTLDTEYNWVDSIKDKEFIKIFHFTHFAQNTSLIAKNFTRLNWDFIIAENNLENSEYFQFFFPEYKKNVYTLPFTFGDKFKKINTFSNRKSICLSTWAIIDIANFRWLFDDFYKYYRINTLQPLRKQIFDNQYSYSSYIENMNTDFRVNTVSNSFLAKLWRLIQWTGHHYYDFDIVEKYNQYKMFVCGEEINWLPWIWFVEWMACGCAYIGKDDSMYSDLWMIPWIHYIAHDGTLEDIIKKIQYYQNNEDELENISQNGYDFVKLNFSREKVADTFYKDIILLSEEYKNNWFNKRQLDFNCSFTPNNEINTTQTL